MQKVILFTSVIVVLVACWIFYLNQEKKNFAENLSQSPVVVNQPINNSSSSVMEDSDNFVEVAGERFSSDGPVHEALPKEQNASAEKKSAGTLTPDEKADFVHDQWIQMFRDIPEVHAASEYTRKIYKQERMTIDEEIAGLAALHHLFPNGGHGLMLEMFKTMKAQGVDEEDFEILYEGDFENARYTPGHKVVHLGDVPEHLRSDASAPDSVPSERIDKDFLQGISEGTPVTPEPKTSVMSDHVHDEDRNAHEPPTRQPPIPMAARGVEAGDWEGLSSEQRENVKQLFDEYGTEEGLRRLRTMDPEAARQFDRQRPAESPRDVPPNDGYSDGQSTDEVP